jgi:prepilin-type N-terminal cleavage/methylation domain-containing protein
MRCNRNKKNSGFTLIEVILSIGIIGIIALAILNVFGFGFKNIVNAGSRTEKVLQEQKALESKIASYSSIGNEEIVLEIKFIENLRINVEGKIAESSESNSILKAFVPKP